MDNKAHHRDSKALEAGRNSVRPKLWPNVSNSRCMELPWEPEPIGAPDQKWRPTQIAAIASLSFLALEGLFGGPSRSPSAATSSERRMPPLTKWRADAWRSLVAGVMSTKTGVRGDGLPNHPDLSQ